MKMLNLRMIVIYLVLPAFVLATAWLLSLLISREMHKSLAAQAERVKRFSDATCASQSTRL
ncbi:MAG: hypothetical protein J6P07_06290 [Spirochaetaceae bacterium]|nr:hypothetical protein [Spirochaetaceae bacterium]